MVELQNDKPSVGKLSNRRVMMEDILNKWEELKKALDHKKAISTTTVPMLGEKAEWPAPSSEHLANAKYGVKNIPGADPFTAGNSKNIGVTKDGDKTMVIRHGAPAHRTAVEWEMAKLLGADHMLAQQSYDPGMHHPDHYQKDTYDRNLHGGTSVQEHVGGDRIYNLSDKEGGLDGLRDQWKNGDLHKLWALHYISNNGDMHPGNFNVGKDGVKAFDSDHAFYELPTAHAVDRYTKDSKPVIKYYPFLNKELPAYLYPFIEGHGDNISDIPHTHKDDQPSSVAINEHAKNIDPDQFSVYGKHALERAVKAKKALLSSDPTAAMLKLWEDHHDKTKGLR